MPTPPRSDELAHEAAEAYKANGNNANAAARVLGLHGNTFDARLKIAAKRGFLLGTPAAMPGFHITQVTNDPNGGEFVQQRPEPGAEFEVPPGHVVKGVSAYVDADRRWRGGWIKTKQGELDPIHVADVLKDAFKDYEPAAPRAAPPADSCAELLTLVPLADLHMGMHAWEKAVRVNWDLKIAESLIGGAIDEAIARSSPSAQCVILGGGDLIHIDSNKNTTTAGTPQDVDGRYDKIIAVAGRLIVRTIESALRQHMHVRVRILKGNHDEHSSVAVAYFLLGWFRNEPRVTVDVDPSLFWWHRFGLVMLGATHGHTVKIEKMPQIMAHRRAEDWGRTKFRYVHGFHLHHSAKFATEGGGCISEIHQAPVPKDGWHFGAGFLSGRSIQAIKYHSAFGEIGRVREVILDGGDQ